MHSRLVEPAQPSPITIGVYSPLERCVEPADLVRLPWHCTGLQHLVKLAPGLAYDLGQLAQQLLGALAARECRTSPDLAGDPRQGQHHELGVDLAVLQQANHRPLEPFHRGPELRLQLVPLGRLLARHHRPDAAVPGVVRGTGGDASRRHQELP
jgi:hypothetical protein